ncbi:hypothetical protein N9V05_01355 [Gammaproteobacteria bacterium]|jgi:hypothetical protein|nr:hypothetical protein [Gammaproteobacteria bacterium]|tara:strand:+ start:196 stop:414 length:219 start_codon:yes stop_codon:yes gene_type:complete
MGGYDFMVVLWIIFIIVGLFRIRDDYRDFIKTKEKMIISLGTKLSMFTGGIAMTLFGIGGLIYLLTNPGQFV